MNKFKKEFYILILCALLTTALCPPVPAVDKDYSNNLLKVDLNKTGSNDVKLTLYTSKSYNVDLKPIKKSNNEYVVILPETYHSITSNPNVKNLGGSVNNVDIKLIPYIGNNKSNGYTKLTIKTNSDDVNFKVENKSVTQSNNILDDTFDEISKITAPHTALKPEKIASASAPKAVVVKKTQTVSVVKTEPKTVAMSLFKEPKTINEGKTPSQKISQEKKSNDIAKVVNNIIKSTPALSTTEPKASIATIVENKSTQESIPSQAVQKQEPAQAEVSQPQAVETSANEDQQSYSYNQQYTQAVQPEQNTAVLPIQNSSNNKQSEQKKQNLIGEFLTALLLFVIVKVFIKFKNSKKSFDYADVYSNSENPDMEPSAILYDDEKLVKIEDLGEFDFTNSTWQEIYRASQEELKIKKEQNIKHEEKQTISSIKMLFDNTDYENAEELTLENNLEIDGLIFPENFNEQYLKEEFLMDNDESKASKKFNELMNENPLPLASTILSKEVDKQNLFNEKYITREESSEPSVLATKNVDENKGFYLVDYENETSLFGFINDNVYLINKFKDLKQSKIYVKKTESKEEKDIYLVQLEKWRALVGVGSDKIETMLEL